MPTSPLITVCFCCIPWQPSPLLAARCHRTCSVVMCSWLINSLKVDMAERSQGHLCLYFNKNEWDFRDFSRVRGAFGYWDLKTPLNKHDRNAWSEEWQNSIFLKISNFISLRQVGIIIKYLKKISFIKYWNIYENLIVKECPRKQRSTQRRQNAWENTIFC